MVCDRNCLMAPLISTFYQVFCRGNTIHITHLCMAVQFHTLLRTGIHSCTAKICNLFDPGNRSDSKFTVETVNCRNTLKFQKSALFDSLCYFRYLFVTQKHLDHDGICKVRHRKNKNCFFVTDFSCFHIHNLTTDNNFSHLTCDGFQIDRIAFKISSIHHIRIAVPAETAMKISSCTFLFESFLFLIRFTFCLCFFAVLFVRCGFFRLFFLCLFRGKFCMFQDICNLLADLQCCILAVLTFLRLHKLQIDLKIHSTALAENFLQILHENLTFFSGNHRIGKCQIHLFIRRKTDLRTFEQIVLKHIIVLQFYFHAGTVNIQKIRRRILFGQMEPFDHCHLHFQPCKELSFNLVFQRYDIFLMDPALTVDIYPQSGFCRIAGYSRNSNHLKPFLQLVFYF